MRRTHQRYPYCLLCGLTVLFCAAVGDADTPKSATKKTEPKDGLVKLDENGAVWLDNRDPKKRRVVLKAEVVLREGALEMLCCLKSTKEHESILAVPTKAIAIHAALIAAGAEPGRPVEFRPEYRPPTGQEIHVFVEWKNDKGELQRIPAQQWVRNVDTGKALAHPWVFAGSMLERDPATGRTYYYAEDGDVICVANFRSAMLDLAVRSSDANDELLFEAFTERIPKVGTPVTIYLEPVSKNSKKEANSSQTSAP